MPIIRVKHDKDNPYFMLNRCAVNDDRLSFKAVGILTYLLSKPDDWTVHEDDLAKRHKEGSTAVRSGLKELRDNGYILSRAARKDGLMNGWEIQVYETPQAARDDSRNYEGDEEVDLLENPVETRYVGFQHNGKPTLLETRRTENPLNGKPAERKTTPLVSNDLLPSNEDGMNKQKERDVKSAEADSSLSGEGGFQFEDKSQPQKSETRILAEKLANGLTAKRKIFAKVNITAWTKEIAKFLSETDVTREEFEKVMDWFLENAGGEFVPQAYCAKSFVEKFPSLAQKSQALSQPNQRRTAFDILREKYAARAAEQQSQRDN